LSTAAPETKSPNLEICCVLPTVDKAANFIDPSKERVALQRPLSKRQRSCGRRVSLAARAIHFFISYL
jgi:hypothetical protein